MKISWPDDTPEALNRFYGLPDGSQEWEQKNLVYVPVPWKLYTSWDPPQPVKGIRVHHKVADSLERVLEDIWKTYGKDQKKLEPSGMTRFGGGYYFRPRRGSRKLSLHAYGAAVDWDPVNNVMKPGNKGEMDDAVVKCFAKEGWRWGGAYGDPMHFEACS